MLSSTWSAAQGFWLDGRSSQRRPAVLQVDGQGQARVSAGEETLQAAHFSELAVSSRLGNTPRRVAFASGGQFETRDHELLEHWLTRWQGSRWGPWVHRLESHWHFVLLSLLVVVVLGWALVTRGVPLAAGLIASHLPSQVAEVSSRQTLAYLDKQVFKPSQLTAEEKQRLQRQFEPVLQTWPELSLQVLFRDGGPLGPNAFALPDGTLVFTDQIIRLAEHEHELLAVLLHEAGHVAERHSLQSLVRSSLLGFLLLAVTGDAGASSELLLGLPVLFLELSHSREFERQADSFALRYLRSHDIDGRHFVNLMTRLQQAGRPADASGTEGDGHRWRDFLSTHPSTEERLQRFQSGTAERTPQ